MDIKNAVTTIFRVVAACVGLVAVFAVIFSLIAWGMWEATFPSTSSAKNTNLSPEIPA